MIKLREYYDTFLIESLHFPCRSAKTRAVVPHAYFSKKKLFKKSPNMLLRNLFELALASFYKNFLV